MNNQGTEPQILKAEWNRDQVNALFSDLQQGAEILHVQVRSNSATRTEDKAVTIAQARELFNQSEATAIQIRYQFDGQTWCDTLMIGPVVTRIIRTNEVRPSGDGEH